jgi:hypothetical protein
MCNSKKYELKGVDCTVTLTERQLVTIYKKIINSSTARPKGTLDAIVNSLGYIPIW